MPDMPIDPTTNTGGAEESYSKMNAEVDPATGPKDGAWKTDSVTVRKAENGGVIATCSKSRERKGKDDYDTYQSKDYAFGSVEDAVAFLVQELGSAAPGGGSSVAPPTPAPGYRG
jgi:hypothetical protein